jgi:phosphoglycolate phosphatase
MIKVVILDYDETLVQTLSSRASAYIALAKEKYNFVLTEEVIKEHYGKPYEDFIHSLFGDVDQVENIIKNYQTYIPKFPNKAYLGSLDCVNLLLQKYKVGVLSGSRRNMMLEDMQKLGFPIDKFFYIQTGEDTNIHKPDPKVFDPLFTHLNSSSINKSEIVYIGDDLRDYEASIGAGIKCICIADHTTSKEVFKSKEINYILDFLELPGKISQL